MVIYELTVSHSVIEYEDAPNEYFASLSAAKKSGSKLWCESRRRAKEKRQEAFEESGERTRLDEWMENYPLYIDRLTLMNLPTRELVLRCLNQSDFVENRERVHTYSEGAA